MFIQYFENYLPSYKGAGKLVFLLQVGDIKSLPKELDEPMTADVLFGSNLKPLMSYLLAALFSDKRALTKEEWHRFISRLPEVQDKEKELNFLLEETKGIARKQLE